MRVYVLTEEPYHDNGEVVGVYLDRDEALAKLKAMPDPSNINESDFQLAEWETENQTCSTVWRMIGSQVWEKGVPVRVEFSFTEKGYVERVE